MTTMTSKQMTTMTSKYTKKVIALVLAFVPLLSMAQTDRDYIRSGNKSFRDKKYPAAEVQYRKALSVNPENPQALYNLGCALMMQNKASEAVKFYQKASASETSKLRKAKIFHNIGIICQSGKMYGEAIKAYSESLRNNPHDNETRYNLALCKKLQKNDKNNKQQQKQKDKDKNKKQDGNDKQQEQQKNNPKQDDKQQKQQQQQPQMSKDNAEQLLNAAMQQEQQTQQKLNRMRQQQQSRRLEKNW